MARRKKRFKAQHPDDFQRLDEELTKALDNLAERSREAELSLGEFASADTDSCPDEDSQESGQQEEPTEK